MYCRSSPIRPEKCSAHVKLPPWIAYYFQSKHHREGGVGVSRGIAPRILYSALNGDEWSAVSFTPDRFIPGYLFDRRLGGAPEPVRTG
jgi:hypothetical protein